MRQLQISQRVSKLQPMRLWLRSSGIYYVILEGGHQRSLKTKDRKLASKIFRKLEREYLQGRLLRIEQKQLKLLSDFISEYLEIRKDNAPNTYRADKLALSKFLDFYGNKPMLGITSRNLAQFRLFLKDSGLKEVSCNVHIRQLKRALKTAIKWDYIKDNPLGDLKQYRIDKSQPVFMSKEGVKTLLRVAGEYSKVMHTAIAIMVYTGCSRSEIIGTFSISKDHISYKRVKTKKLITLPIAKGLRPYISGLHEGINKILTWRNPRTFSKHFERIVKTAGLKGITPHKVRHTFASYLLDKGVDLKTISELMGHTSIHITAEFYAHLKFEKKQQALDMLDF